MNTLLLLTGVGLGVSCTVLLDRYRNKSQYRQFQQRQQEQFKMSKASYNAFMDGLNSRRRDTLKETIYRAFVDGPKNRRALAVYLANQGLHPSMSSITGRISELQDMGAVWEATEGVYQVCRTEQQQREQRTRRFNERKRRWVAEGQRNGWL
jgi:hypothetical protein